MELLLVGDVGFAFLMVTPLAGVTGGMVAFSALIITANFALPTSLRIPIVFDFLIFLAHRPGACVILDNLVVTVVRL